MNYFEKVGYPLFSYRLSDTELKNYGIRPLLTLCCEHFQRWNDRLDNVQSEHAAWVGFVYALLVHLDELETDGDFIEVGPDVQHSLQLLMSRLLATGFNFTLPEVDDVSLNDFYSYCEEAWNKQYGDKL